MPNPNGRPSKLTPEVHKHIVAAVRAGNYLKHAAQSAGVSYDCLWEWVRKGEKAEAGIYYEFAKAIKKAEADAITRNVTIIQKAAVTTWTAAAWWLERKFPDEFGRKEKTELTGEIRQKIKQEVKVIAPDALKSAIEALVAGGAVQVSSN